MRWIVHYLWLIPALLLLAAGLSALAPQRCRKFAASLAVGSMALALVLSCIAFVHKIHFCAPQSAHEVYNFRWFQFAPDQWLELGWVLDPLGSLMLVMVCFVGLLIFIYSIGYMSHDENFTRFFCFLSLFAAAMLGVVIANNLLLLFICWEIVGLTSYLLIGFWYHKPSAAAAAKKAFITTRIGDLALLLGMVWLYSKAGTLLFYANGKGCLEQSALTTLTAQTTASGMAVLTGIGLLIFCGAVGKSGQVPLHVWLPDAMEGPTPVSALIHAATMVAAGVFLVARVYPLMSPSALQVVTWVGCITALFAASIAVAQTDIKRILAYSTVSQLGFMMMGLGAGGVAVGMFHLITHAFFKALLFLGAGSVIHSCHDEQEIQQMGGLRKYMPLTFATYAVGMLALSGFPVVFSGFWSKDEILHAAHGWPVSRGPFYFGLLAAFLTAFYMTRQVGYVFFGKCRLKLGRTTASEQRTVEHGGVPASEHPGSELAHEPHESPRVMTLPLIVLAACTVVLGFFGTPAWPWFQSFLGGEELRFNLRALAASGVLWTMVISSLIALAGIAFGWWFYIRRPVCEPLEVDPVERLRPDIFHLLRRKYYVDEIYDWSFVRLNGWWARSADWLDRWVWNGVVQGLSYLVLGLAWLDRVLDEYVLNSGFDEGCQGLSLGGRILSRFQNGRVQNYLRVIGIGLGVLLLFLIFRSS